MFNFKEGDKTVLVDYDLILRTRALERTDFGLLSNYVFFVDSHIKSDFGAFIKDNMKALEKRLKNFDRNFVIPSEIGRLDTNIFHAVKFQYPQLYSVNYFPDSLLDKTNLLLDYFYLETRKIGLIETDREQKRLVFHEVPELIDRGEMISYITSFCVYIKEKYYTEREDFAFNAPYSVFFNDDEVKVEDSIAEEIKEIVEQIELIKAKGLIVSALPVFEKISQSYALTLNNQISYLLVDEDFRMILTDFNVEIKLSHLTKAIYLLYLLYPEGFTTEELKRKGSELLKIYITVSNQHDLYKLKETIDNFLCDEKAIYVHLSRIKSEFHRNMQSNIADSYTIKGRKNSAKRIALDRNKTNIASLRELLKI